MNKISKALKALWEGLLKGLLGLVVILAILGIGWIIWWLGASVILPILIWFWVLKFKILLGLIVIGVVLAIISAFID